MYGMGCKNINWEKGKGKKRSPAGIELCFEVVTNDNMRLYLREYATITPRGFMGCKFVYIFIIKNKFVTAPNNLIWQMNILLLHEERKRESLSYRCRSASLYTTL